MALNEAHLGVLAAIAACADISIGQVLNELLRYDWFKNRPIKNILIDGMPYGLLVTQSHGRAWLTSTGRK
jgi:hypothetical protein